MRLQPVLVKGQQRAVAAQDGEAVEVSIPDPAPVDERDAELEGGLGLPDEVILMDAERLVEGTDVRTRTAQTGHKRHCA